MAGTFGKGQGIPGGKYLVQRRDGSVPEWSWFVLGARDPEAADTLRDYAARAERAGRDPEYVANVRQIADEFDAERAAMGSGDPDAPKHRVDDPETVAMMLKGKGA